MFALRSLSRGLSSGTMARSSVRSLSSATRTILPRAALRPVVRMQYPAFSTSTTRREPAGQFDQELSAKIAQEHTLELEAPEDGKEQRINDFLKDSPFTFVDKPGSHEIILTRDFGNEKIKVEMSVSDVNNLAEEEEFDNEDNAFDDEEDFDHDKRTINQSKGGKVDVMPEDKIAPADREGDIDADDYPSAPSYPISLLVTITKPNNQALQIGATATDGNIEIENLTVFNKASLVDADTGKEAREASAVYQGPPISNLDPELQLLLERYLEERGINAELAVFLPDYVDNKEQKEYVSWLANLQKFVDA